MTAQTDETVNETVETAEENAPTFDVSTLDEFGQEFVNRTTADINKLNALLTERKSKSSDPAEIAESLYDTLKAGEMPEGVTTLDAKILDQYNKASEIVDKALAHFRSLSESIAKERVAQSVNAEEVAALDTEIETVGKKVKRARDMLALEYPGAETVLPDVIRKSGSSSGSGKGSGGRKLRGFTVTVDGNVALLSNAEGKKVSSFSAGAKVLGIPTADLQRAYMAAAGTEDAEKFPASQDLTVTGSDNKEHAVNITRNAE